jgi:hypothetical protein
MLPLAVRLARPLALAALAEVLLLRLLMRMGAHLPLADRLQEVYRGLQLLGMAAANLVSLLALALIVLFGLAVLRGRRWVDRLAGAAAIAAAGWQAGLAVLPSASASVAVATLTALALALALAFAVSPLRGWARAGAATLLAAYLAAAYYAVAQPARALGVELPGALAAYFAGEALALAGAAGALLIVWPGLRRGPAVAAAATGLLVLAARLLQPWTTGLAVMWTVAFSLYLPAPVYALAAALFTYALLASWRASGAARVRACGLLLIALAGLKLDYGYFALMALAGYLLAAGDVPAPSAAVVAGEAAARPAARLSRA